MFIAITRIRSSRVDRSVTEIFLINRVFIETKIMRRKSLKDSDEVPK